MMPSHPRENLEINMVTTGKSPLYLTLFLLLLAVIGSGCNSAFHESVHYAHIDKNHFIGSGTQLKVGSVTNETEHDFDIDVEHMLADAFTEQLRKEKLLWEGGNNAKLILDAKIVGYQKGGAFKRWLIPGWGSTNLIIHCVLKDGTNIVGTVQAKGEVAWGGGFTVGAWKNIFDNVAKDAVRDLKTKINK